MISMASANRSDLVIERQLNARYSGSCQPAPTPRTRPSPRSTRGPCGPSFASRPGERKPVQLTRQPIWARDVTAAIAASSVQPSRVRRSRRRHPRPSADDQTSIPSLARRLGAACHRQDLLLVTPSTPGRASSLMRSTNPVRMRPDALPAGMTPCQRSNRTTCGTPKGCRKGWS